MLYADDKIKKTEMGRTCSTYGERPGACRVLVGDLREGDNFEYPGVDGRVIIKWILKNGMRTCTGSIWLRIGTVSWLL